MITPSPGRPRVSMILLAYNQQDTVHRAAESCLAQDCEPLEIVLSDDASTDSTFEILQELATTYRGPHKVTARRSAANVGIGEHYNQLLAATSGDLLVTAAGDDWSAPDRVRRLIEAWEATECKADLIASHVVDLDHDDQLHEVMRVDDLSKYRSIHDWVARRPYIIGAGHAFTRRVMERFGPMSPGIFYEDQIMVFRAIVSGGAVVVDAPMVHYRRGGTSRKPRFDSPQHMRQWSYRQRSREEAEMVQLLADAEVAGHRPLVEEKLALPLKRVRYLQALADATTPEQRWDAYAQAAPLSHWWRLRKMMHVRFPEATVTVKRWLAVLNPKHH